MPDRFEGVAGISERGMSLGGTESGARNIDLSGGGTQKNVLLFERHHLSGCAAFCFSRSSITFWNGMNPFGLTSDPYLGMLSWRCRWRWLFLQCSHLKVVLLRCGRMVNLRGLRTRFPLFIQFHSSAGAFPFRTRKPADTSQKHRGRRRSRNMYRRGFSPAEGEKKVFSALPPRWIEEHGKNEKKVERRKELVE